MNHTIDEEQLAEIAAQHGLTPWPIEAVEGKPIAFYIDRDIEDTSLYNIARVVVSSEREEVTAHCSLCNAKGKVADDPVQVYPNISVAVVDIKKRFDSLRAPYQPRKKVERKTAPSPVRFIH